MLGGTEIGGNVHGLLAAENSPYLVISDITVDEQNALFIQAGVTLLFKPGTGLYVRNGSLTVAGNSTAPVTFRSALEPSKPGSWKGIFLTGQNEFNFFKANISDAEVGIAIEKGSISLQASQIANTSSRGVYVRDAKASITATEFSGNKGIALHAGNYANINADQTSFHDNNFALLNSELANTVVHGSDFKGNEYAVVGKENNQFSFHETQVTGNKTGAAGIDIIDNSVIRSVYANDNDFGSASIALLSTLPSNPEVPGVERRPFNPSDKIGVLNREAKESSIPQDSGRTWSILGNVMLGGNYHYVRTRTNRNGKTVIGNDTIANGQRFKNVFQVPGLGGELAAYLYMQSSDGKTIEFNTDITSDSWNHFSPNPVTLTYKDQLNQVILGDHEKSEGEIYMSGMPLFGIDYTLTLFKNNADNPLFEFNTFFGEAKRSMVPGDRHPYIYKDYIEDGTAQAQRLAYGASFKWAPVRRFDAKIGAIYANDELKDPLLRDGTSDKYTTADPMINAFTMYADGNWLFFPGDIELNGQIAVGRADTADVVRQRAINKVFSNAGISTSAYALLRQLMQNQSKIDRLTDAELYSIFTDNTTLSRPQMRDSLRALVREAKNVQKDEEEDRDKGRVLGLNWGSQNFAIGASLNWNIYKTSISGHIKYVGEDFYSAGSPNQLSDTREFGGRLEQDILGFWDLGFGYQINVENAAKGKKTNIFGLSEGSEWGLFGEDEGKWFDEHELDIDRTKYIHNIGLDNQFKVNKTLDLSLAYNFEYKTQYRPFQLHHDFILEDGIYKDKWFHTRRGRDSTMIVDGDDSTYVDASRWSEYMALASEPFLASRFQEKLFKHTWNVGATVRAFSSVIKANGVFTYRVDGSLFHRDSLVEDLTFSNDTWGKLGYFFGGSDYFEHSYPISVATTLPILQNRFAVTPRFKSYSRDNMGEFEISIEDEFEMPLKDRFFILGINAGFRYMNTEWEEDDKDLSETETDILGGANFRINHTKHFYSEWFAGTALYFRPDNLSNEYTDIYFGVNAHYVF